MPLEQAVAYATAAAHAPAAAEPGPAPDGAGGVALLTPREREIASLVAQGLSNRKIAARLVMSERTAETHVQHILNKLRVDARTQIGVWAVRHGLTQPTA